MSAIMFVRITSALTAEEVDKRKPRFLPVAGLIQKIYGRDPATGDVCGIYCFDSGDALTAFQV